MFISEIPVYGTVHTPWVHRDQGNDTVKCIPMNTIIFLKHNISTIHSSTF